MDKRSAVRYLLVATLCGVFLVGSVEPAKAVKPGAGIAAKLFQAMMQLAGLEATLQHGSDDAYPCMVTVRVPGNISFTLGFPAGGIQKGMPFYLATDDYAAVVKFSDAGRLVVIDGDERIVAIGIFSMVTCILSSVAAMVSDIVEAALSINILAILQAVFSGVINIVSCVSELIG